MSGTTEEGWATGFPPVEPRLARTLILGTLPSKESMRRGEYYAHPRNAFWPIMGELFGAGREMPHAERIRALANQGVMLWDVLHAAHRPGSLDANIDPRRLEPNDIPSLLARHGELRQIVFNGVASKALFGRHVRKACGNWLEGVELATAPSTSPAHASKSFAEKLREWRAILNGI